MAAASWVAWHFPPLLAAEGIGWGTILATALNSVAAGNTANAIDALIDGGEGGVSLENHDLTKAVGKAIAAVITLAAKQQRGKTRQYLEKIAAQAKDNWLHIAQQELTQQRYPELREAKLDQFLTPEEYHLTQQGNLTATEWGDIFIRLNMAACKGGGFAIPPEVRQYVAELLHTTFPKALRETLKEDFANDGKAFAGLTLQLLTRMQAQLSQLQASQGGINAEEFSQIPQQFQELETQLRGTVAQQQTFFNQISHRIDSGFAEVCQQLGVMENTITGLLESLEERLEELRQEVTEFRQEVRQGFESLQNQPGGRSLSKQEYRQRQSVLTQMRTEVESRLSQSIHRAAIVNLGKEQQPQQVQRPWDMSVKVGEQRSVQLPHQTTILDVFDNPTISGKFLILGKPGGGKTTTLLELAEALIERADGDSDAPIPVILELSSWQEVTKPKFLPFGEREKYDPSIKEWVLSQLMSKGVSQEMGEQWLREKELVLLLDGLDELQPERQGKCVRAINQFLSNEFSPLHLVVCSRKEEYEVYEEMLHLNGAICLEDLTNEQIRDYFTSVNLEEFWESIKGSEKIVNFIRQPLFLAISSIAYRQIDVEEWQNCNTEERAIDYLIGVYRIHVFGINIKNYNVSLILKAIAQEIVHYRKFTFQEIDPLSFLRRFNKRFFWYFFIATINFPLLYFLGNISWKQAAKQTPLYDLSISSVGATFSSIVILLKFVFGFTVFLGILGAILGGISCILLPTLLFHNIFWINVLLMQEMKKSKNKNPVFQVLISILVVLTETFIEIKNTIIAIFDSAIELLHLKFSEIFSTSRFLQSASVSRLLSPGSTTFVLYLGEIILVVIGSLIYLLMLLIALPTLLIILIVFLIILISFIIPLTFLAWFHVFVLIKIRESHKNIFESGVLTSLIATFSTTGIGILSNFLYFASIFNFLNPDKTLSFISILTVSSSLALYYGIIWAGGSDLIKYCGFRLILGFSGIMPWNITRFLDYCTERLILQRVGNRYRFIHRLVQEYFAKLEI